MAYVQPKSNIYLIKGCPCDRSYNNTIYFESKLTQWAYFRDLVTHTFTNQYYQRYNRGYLRIQANAEDLYEINYMVFSNSYNLTPTAIPPNSAKIFYCFVDNIEYINENVTEIHYTIDIMQTYMFDYTLGECFVEREHTLTDNMFGNIVPEDIDCGEFEYNLLTSISLPYLNRNGNNYSTPLYSIMIEYMPNTHCIGNIQTWLTDPTDPSNYLSSDNMIIDWIPIGVHQGVTQIEVQGEMRNNTYCGTRYAFLDIPPSTGSASLIQQYMGRICNEMLGSNPSNTYVFALQGLERIFSNDGQRAAIVNLTIVPRIFNVMSGQSSTPYYTLDDAFSATYQKTYSVNEPTSFSSNYIPISYTPKNKKMFTSPFCTVIVTDDNGNERQYQWEEFAYTQKFKLQLVNVSQPSAILTPYGYKGKEYDIGKMSVICSDFPTAKWTEDSYLSYIASNKGAILSQGASAITNMVGANIGQMRRTGTIRQYSGGDSTTTTTSGTKISHRGGLTTGIQHSGTSTTTYDPKISIQQDMYDYVPNPIGALSSAQALADVATKLYDTSRSPDPTYGSTNYSAIRNINNLFGYKIYCQFPRLESAQRIDKYFSVFGYAIKNVKTPNIVSAGRNSLRPHWNYIKNMHTIVLPYTEGNTKRYVGTDIEEAIQAIYDKGITFWMHGEEVGDYSLNNAPQS